MALRDVKNHLSELAEVRAILDAAADLPEENILLALHATFAEAGGVDLQVPERQAPSLPRPSSQDRSK